MTPIEERLEIIFTGGEDQPCRRRAFESREEGIVEDYGGDFFPIWPRHPNKKKRDANSATSLRNNGLYYMPR